MTLSVVVPSYSRAEDLNGCLQALSQQLLAPQEILVVCRRDDDATRQVIARWSALLPVLCAVPVDGGGQVAALNAGLEACRGDIVAFTDDDARPWPNWTLQIEAHFAADARIGGVGGRDWLYQEGVLQDGAREIVGQITCFGRAVGNHHLGCGPARQVQFLKGANMSYRRAAIASQRFNRSLKGCGAQVCNDMDFGLCLGSQGWKLIYDPEVAVDHHLAPRLDSDGRGGFNLETAINRIHNETLVMLSQLSRPRRGLFWLYAALIGSKISPGIGMIPLLIRSRRFSALPALWASLCGRMLGLRSWLRSRR